MVADLGADLPTGDRHDPETIPTQDGDLTERLRGEGGNPLRKSMKIGIKVVRVVSMLVFIWMAMEGIRCYYFARADLARYMEVAKFLLGPWFAMFSVAAGGSHLKRWTEAIKASRETKKNDLQGITG